MDRPPDESPTIVLGRIAPAWGWARKSFSLPSLLTILGIAGAAIGDHVSLTIRVAKLEGEIAGTPTAAAVAALKVQQDSQDERITRLENNWDDAAKTAGMPPVARKRR